MIERAVPLITDYLNRLVGVLFHPIRFFSVNKFPEHEWNKDAIRFFIISYIIFVTIFSLTLISILMQKTPSHALYEVFQNSFSRISLVITSVIQLIFVNTLVLYALLNWSNIVKKIGELKKKNRKQDKRNNVEYEYVSPYKIINMLSYLMGTTAIVFSILIKKVMPELIDHYRCNNEGHPVFSCPSNITICLGLFYIVCLFFVSHRKSFNLTCRKTTIIFFLEIGLTFFINVIVF